MTSRAAPNHPEPEVVILRALLGAGDAWVSGSTIAGELGVSRVAVWGHLQKLRDEGFEFEAVRSRGYRLKARPAGFSPALIRALLRQRPGSPGLLFLPTVDSTNDEAERQLAAQRATPFVILAAEQTHGRGRFGRIWHSPNEGNLYATFVFRPELPPGRMQLFTLWMGLSLCEVLANFCRVAPGLKWPNDLHYDGKKVGGMLTEARIDADHIRELVFGLGLNVNATPGTWPKDVARTATSLAQVLGQALDLNALAAAVVGRVLTAYEDFVAGDKLGTIAELWQRYDVLAGKRITVLIGDRKVEGTARGIDDEGALLLKLDHGKTERFRAGEVTIQKT